MKKKGNIMVADDDEIIRDFYNKIIAKNFPQFDIEGYRNGGELEKRLQNFPGESRLVLLDNEMFPGKTGLDLIKDYALSDQWKNIPFILCYGGDKGFGKKALEYGAFNYLNKPISIPNFLRNIREALTEQGFDY